MANVRLTQLRSGVPTSCLEIFKPKYGKPPTVPIPKIVDQIHVLILSDPEILSKRTAEIIDIFRECVEFVIPEKLDYVEVGLCRSCQQSGYKNV